MEGAAASRAPRRDDRCLRHGQHRRRDRSARERGRHARYRRSPQGRSPRARRGPGRGRRPAGGGCRGGRLPGHRGTAHPGDAWSRLARGHLPHEADGLDHEYRSRRDRGRARDDRSPAGRANRRCRARRVHDGTPTQGKSPLEARQRHRDAAPLRVVAGRRGADACALRRESPPVQSRRAAHQPRRLRGRVLLRLARQRVARRTVGFTESVIREMTRLSAMHGGINLAQGFPNFPAPQQVKDAAKRAIDADINQYAITWGSKSLRDALARTYLELYAMQVDPETMLTVTCGSTEAMISTLLAICDPGDEVIVLEPFYENYGPDAAISGATPIFVPLRPPSFEFDADELSRAFGPRTKAIIVNTPNNPTGRVFTRAELETIATLCREHDVIAVTDEIYEHILYEGEHIPIVTLAGMAECTVTISGASKTFSVTGWRVGWIVAPPELTAAIRKVHDFVTVGAPAPFQEAIATALDMGRPYYDRLATEYHARRDHLVRVLDAAGFSPNTPQGAYYVVCDIRPFGFDDDVTFANWLVREIGVAGVPGSSFFSRRELGRHLIRFTFCKTADLLDEAGARLLKTASMAMTRANG